MSLSEAVYNHLLSIAPLAALVGSSPNARIWRDTIPAQPAYPAVVFSIVGGTSFSAFDGPAQLGRALIQIDSFASSAAVADSVEEAVRAGFLGIDQVVAGVRLRVVESVRLVSFFEEDATAAQLNLFRRTRDYTVVHNEA